jgi:hypothetical protein
LSVATLIEAKQGSPSEQDARKATHAVASNETNRKSSGEYECGASAAIATKKTTRWKISDVDQDLFHSDNESETLALDVLKRWIAGMKKPHIHAAGGCSALFYY